MKSTHTSMSLAASLLLGVAASSALQSNDPSRDSPREAASRAEENGMGRPAWVNEQGLMTSTDLDFELVRRTARLDRQLHSTCSEGDSFVVTTMSFTEFELGGCYQDTGEEFNGGVVYATEGSNADQNRLVIPQLFNGTETGENQVVWTMGELTVEDQVSLYTVIFFAKDDDINIHPVDATWFYLVDDGSEELTESQLSLECGCHGTEAPTLSSTSAPTSAPTGAPTGSLLDTNSPTAAPTGSLPGTYSPTMSMHDTTAPTTSSAHFMGTFSPTTASRGIEFGSMSPTPSPAAYTFAPTAAPSGGLDTRSPVEDSTSGAAGVENVERTRFYTLVTVGIATLAGVFLAY